jgi:hypothetical protein
MIIDFRYHVATLAAVFLALALGILIGTTMIGNDVLVKEQKRLIDRLEQDFSSIRAEKKALSGRIAELESEVERDKQFEKVVLPPLIKNRLSGKRIAVVCTYDTQDSQQLLDKINSTLKSAGAVVTSSTRLLPGPDLSDEKKKEAAVSVLSDQTSDADEAIITAAAKEIASDIAMGTNIAIPTFTNLKMIHTTGQYNVPVDSVVIVSGRIQEPAGPKVDDALIESFKDLGISIVGVESADVPFSQVKVFKNQHVSTVDNVESSMGLLSLVVSLQGASGDFGTKDTARQLIPDLSLWTNP